LQLLLPTNEVNITSLQKNEINSESLTQAILDTKKLKTFSEMTKQIFKELCFHQNKSFHSFFFPYCKWD